MGPVLGRAVADGEAALQDSSVYPDYMLNPNAVTKDTAEWRHGCPPDYTQTRKMWAKVLAKLTLHLAEKRSRHEANCLETLVENLVKNWEIEASHKSNVSEWRTIDHDKYTFAINGGPPQDAEHMKEKGTYSAIIAPNKYYGSAHCSFDESHKTFRDMMPNFAWEVLEVYSGPPTVAFRWRHWGWMKGDYVGRNEDGSLVTIKSHSEILDIQGITVAKLNGKCQITSLETWFDPMDMFNQMRPSKETMTTKQMECPLGYGADLKTP